MPFNGSGNYVPPSSPVFPPITGTIISSSYFTQIINDLSSALSLTFLRDGSVPMGGNLKLAGNILYLSPGQTLFATDVGGSVFSGPLTIGGSSAIAGNLTVAVNAAIGGNLAITGLLTTGNVTVTGNISVAVNAAIAGNLGVTGAADVTGNLTVRGTSQTFVGASASQVIQDTTGNATTVVSGGTIPFSNFSGMLVITNYNNSSTALYLCGAGTATLIGASAGSPGTVIYDNSINGYRYSNNTGSNGNISIYSLRTRLSA